MKEKIIIAGVLIIAFILFTKIHESRAGEVEITQHLYDQAISVIQTGDRNKGCRILHEAFAHSAFIDDNWKIYNHIWNVGTLTCNWSIRPDTMETSSPKP